MNRTMELLVRTVSIGIGGSAAMDLWALLLRYCFGVRSLDYGLYGRWIGHLTRGQFTHGNIANSPNVLGEKIHRLDSPLSDWNPVRILADRVVGSPVGSPTLFGSGADNRLQRVLLHISSYSPVWGLASRPPEPRSRRYSDLEPLQLTSSTDWGSIAVRL